MSEVVVIAGAKGKTGKTFFASNLAVALGQLGHRSAILDLNGSRHAAGNFFGVRIPYDVNDVVWGHCAPEAVFVPCMEHVDLIALGDPMGWTDAEKMTRMISLLPMLDTRDFIIVDVPASNFTGLIPAVEAASALFAIVTPERVANGDALCCIHELDRHVRETSINIVVNRVTSPDLAEVICGRLEHDCGKILRVRSQCVACLPEIALPPKDEPIRLPMVNSSPDSLFFRLMSRIAQGLSRSAGKNRGADRLQLLLEGLFRAFPEDTFLWLPDARELAFEPSSGLEKEISLLRELVAGARDNGEIGALDLADLCRLIRQAVEPAAKERASLGVPTAS